MISLRDLTTQVRIALATQPKVTINHPKPKQLWRALKKELPVCDRHLRRSQRVRDLEGGPVSRAKRVRKARMKARQARRFDKLIARGTALLTELE